jgi:hypothetical protein
MSEPTIRRARKYPTDVIVVTRRQVRPGGRPEPDEGTVTYAGGQAHVDDEGTLRISNPDYPPGRYRAVYRAHEYESYEVVTHLESLEPKDDEDPLQRAIRALRTDIDEETSDA